MTINGRRTIALWLLLAVVVLSPLAIGGVHTTTAVVAAFVSLLALATLLRWRWKNRLGFVVTPLGWALLALLVGVGMQLIPLPPALLAALSPRAAELREGAAALVGAPGGGELGGWAPVSLSPAATARDLLRLAAVVATFLGVAGLVRVRQHAARTTLSAVVLVAVTLVGIALVQELLGVELLLGFYRPQSTEGHRFFWSTFVNQNHFAAFLCLSAPVALGLALDGGTPKRRTSLYLAASVALSATIFLTLSRAGVLVFFGEAALLALLVWLGRGERHKGERSKLPFRWGTVAALFVGVVIVAMAFVLPRFVEDWRALGSVEGLNGYAKLATLPDAWRLIRQFMWVGAGHGAYPEVFPAFDSQLPDYTFHYIENGPLQLAADVGLPVAIVLLLVGLVVFVPLVLRSRSRPMLMGAAVGLVGLLVENLTDFSLEMPGVALPAAAVLGVLVGKSRPLRARARAQGEDAPSAGSSRPAIVGLVVTGLVALGLIPAAWAALTQPLGATREAVAGGEPGALSAAVWWHPADPVVATAAGRRAEVDGDIAAARAWFRRAGELAPTAYWPAMHVLRTAVAAGSEDATRESEIAAALGVLTEWHWKKRDKRGRYLRLLAGHKDALRLLGESIRWQPALVVEASQTLLRLGARRSSERLLKAALDHREDDPTLLEALAESRLARRDVKGAEALATRLIALHPDRSEGFLVQGDLALVGGDEMLAEHMYREAARLAPDQVKPLFRRARVLMKLEEWGRLESVFRQIAKRGAGSREAAELLSLRAQAAARQGSLQDALRLTRDAVRELPGYVPYLHQLAGLLERLDRRKAALNVHRKVLERRPDDPTSTAAITRLRGSRDSERGGERP